MFVAGLVIFLYFGSKKNFTWPLLRKKQCDLELNDELARSVRHTAPLGCE